MPYFAELALSACLIAAVLAGYGGWLLRRLLPSAGAILLPDDILAGAPVTSAVTHFVDAVRRGGDASASLDLGIRAVAVLSTCATAQRLVPAFRGRLT